MPGKRETNHTGSSVLKTTTWGALIALTAATLVAGLLGHRQWTHSGDLGRPLLKSRSRACRLPTQLCQPKGPPRTASHLTQLSSLTTILRRRQPKRRGPLFARQVQLETH